ncbi:MAG: beta galactosidase jelly roll domain-containing protein, partial [Alteromonadaceae bacterium]|nr:beta galactosidase jelly roll domain-containing protein [Alteromonadaceae bacterium]
MNINWLNRIGNRVLLLVVLVSSSLAVSSNEQVNPNLTLRVSQSLNGDWAYIVDPYENGYYNYRWDPFDAAEHPSKNAYFMDATATNKQELLEYNFDKEETLKVPGDWNTQDSRLYYYEGTLWYRNKFSFNDTSGDKRAFIHFGAVNYRADVYLNGQKLGTHIGGFTPFSYEVTNIIKPGSNSLVVRVDNKRLKEGVPTINTDWWNYGGITRPVTLVTTPRSFIRQHKIQLDSETSKVISGKVVIDGKITADTMTVSIPELNAETTVPVSEHGIAQFTLKPDGLQLWAPDSPKLYKVELTYHHDKVVDEIGFRTIRTQGKELLLNGEPVMLKGIALHEELALNGGGRVKNEDEARQQLLWAKDLNANFIRLSHYPHSEAMVRLAEKMGFLLWSEIPVYWTIDWTNEATYQNAQNQLTEMIERDYNRAGVIIWSLANETPVKPERTRFLERLATQARELDDSRVLSAAMERHWGNAEQTLSVVEDPLADIVDMVSFNQYLGWYVGPPEKIDQVSWKIPYDKPVFISEFGAGAKYGLHGAANERWTEEYQATLYAKTIDMSKNIDGFVGFSPWILVDFRSPRRTLPGIQDDFNRKGLVSEKGEKK